MNALCPICGEPATSTDVREGSAIVTGNFLDAAGHVWLTKWFKEEESRVVQG